MPITVDAFEARIRAAEDVNLDQVLQWADELGVDAFDGEIDAGADRLWAALGQRYLEIERERLVRLLDLVPLWEHLIRDGTPAQWERYGRLLIRVRLEIYGRLQRGLGTRRET